MRRAYKDELFYIRDRAGEHTPADHQRRYYHRRGKYIKAINVVMKNLHKPIIDFTGYSDHDIQIQHIFTCESPEKAKKSQLLYNFARLRFEHLSFHCIQKEEALEYLNGLKPLKPLFYISKYENMYEELEKESENYHFCNSFPREMRLMNGVDNTNRYESLSPYCEDYYTEKELDGKLCVFGTGKYSPILEKDFTIFYDKYKILC